MSPPEYCSWPFRVRDVYFEGLIAPTSIWLLSGPFYQGQGCLFSANVLLSPTMIKASGRPEFRIWHLSGPCVEACLSTCLTAVSDRQQSRQAGAEWPCGLSKIFCCSLRLA